MSRRARPADLAALPATSVAEFRKAAWPVLDDNLTGAITMRLYLTWAALGLGVGLLVLAVAGLATSPMAWWFVAGSVLVIGLVSWRIRNQYRRGAQMRRLIDAQSKEIDSQAARGHVPVTPPGWDGGILPAPHERRGS